MNDLDLEARLRAAIVRAYGTSRTPRAGKLTHLKCPACGKPEAWADRPWAILCPRQNECGAISHTKDLFPDLFRKIERDYPATPEAPHRPALAFLRARGLNGSVEGVAYEYWPRVRNLDTGAVMFRVEGDVWNGRLLHPPAGEGKTHNQGSTRGKFWRHPRHDYSTGPVYVVEGIIDALSLVEVGCNAIAVLSAGSDPPAFDLSAFTGRLVLAFDSDKAGRKAFRAWQDAHPNVDAIAPPKGRDWNDLLCSGMNAERFDEERPEYEFNARLLLAETAQDYAQAFLDHKGHPPGLFDFDGEMWWPSTKADSGETVVTCSRVGNFTVEVEHFALDTALEDTPRNRFVLKIHPKGGRPVKCTVTADDLSNRNSLTRTFIERARVVWEGDQKPSLALARQITSARAPVVRHLQTVGFDPESGCYVFKRFAIGPDGRVLNPDTRGFFALSRHDLLAPAHHDAITPNGGDPRKIVSLLCDAWGEKAALALAWTVAGWFVHLIRPELGFFPFLSFFGKSQTGKTHLTRFLNYTQGIFEEGLPMNKVNTGKGEIRKLAQRSSVSKALLEAQKDHKGRFDLDSLLTLYNDGNPLQTRAQTSQDLQTNDVPFLSTLLFVQNNEPFRTKPQKERVISVLFSPDELTDATSAAHDALEDTPNGHFPSVMVEVMKHRQKIKRDWRTWFDQAKVDLSDVHDARIRENHAVVLAFARFLSEVFDVPDVDDYIRQLAERKIDSCRERASTPADEFIEHLMGMGTEHALFADCVNIDLDSGVIYVRLEEATKVLREERYDLPRTSDIRRSLIEHAAWVNPRTKDGKPTFVRPFSGDGSKKRCYGLKMAELSK